MSRFLSICRDEYIEFIGTSFQGVLQLPNGKIEMQILNVFEFYITHFTRRFSYFTASGRVFAAHFYPKPVADKNHLHLGDVSPDCQNWHGPRPSTRKLLPPWTTSFGAIPVRKYFTPASSLQVIDPWFYSASFHELDNRTPAPLRPLLSAFSKRNEYLLGPFVRSFVGPRCDLGTPLRSPWD